MENDERRTYSIGELAEEVGVSTRTIRYYVSEGLLPPPVGSGPGSGYTEAHRAQLVAINALKEQYLPLKEIRKRLVGFNLPSAGPASGNWVRIMEEAAAPEPQRSHKLSAVQSSVGSRVTNRDYASRSLSFANDIADPPAAVPLAAALPTEAQTWHRVAISDEAELLITEDQYRRHQDRIDWLVQWAQRVLES